MDCPLTLTVSRLKRGIAFNSRASYKKTNYWGSNLSTYNTPVVNHTNHKQQPGEFLRGHASMRVHAPVHAPHTCVQPCMHTHMHIQSRVECTSAPSRLPRASRPVPTALHPSPGIPRTTVLTSVIMIGIAYARRDMDPSSVTPPAPGSLHSCIREVVVVACGSGSTLLCVSHRVTVPSYKRGFLSLVDFHE